MWEPEIREIVFPSQSGQKEFMRLRIQWGKILGMVVHACHPSNAGRIMVWASLGKRRDLISKITRARND
jgi:hypothetical protein